MDYKLAKELKNAGFRIKPCIVRDGFTEKGGVVKNDLYNYNKDPNWRCDGEHYFIPTLSELIEACFVVKDESDGRYSFNLERRIIDNDGMLEVQWRANRDSINGEWRATPEEAVARLWLSLNNADNK